MNDHKDLIEKDPVGEILGMGGPWVMELTVQGRKIEGLFVDQEIIFNTDRSKIALVRYAKSRFTFFRFQVKFLIQIHDIQNRISYVCKTKFNALSIVGFSDNTIHYRPSFSANQKTIEAINFGLYDNNWEIQI